MTGALIMGTTLPTVIGMGVVSRTTETMFAKDRRPGTRARKPSATVTVGVATRKVNADKFATKYRKALRQKGMPYTGRVKVKKVSGGYAITYRRG